MKNLLLKTDRFFAWILFLGMFLYFISGYGMTKGIIDPSQATKLHLSYLTYIVLVAFTIHTSYAIHLAFKRWGIWNTGTKIMLISFFALFALAFFYVDKFYQKGSGDKDNVVNSGKATTSTSTSQVTNSSENNATTSENTVITDNSNLNQTTENSSEEKTFTKTELAKYNGENGNPAYVAVDGDIYDLSSVFAEGKHFSHYAGTELTNAFYSYHAKKSLSKYPIVGKLVN